jgi:hypothetical protein
MTALEHLKIAGSILMGDKPDVSKALAAVMEAIRLIEGEETWNPYTDSRLRPGLGKPEETNA